MFFGNREKVFEQSPAEAEELSPACQQLIIDHHKWASSFSSSTQLPCIYGDVLKQIPSHCDLSALSSFAEKKRKLDATDLNQHQYCWTHNTECSLEKEVILDFSGLPCPDYSRANAKRKREEGPSGPET